MKIEIRPEIPSDFEVIERVITEAFKSAKHTDKDEHGLVARLRASSSYISELALVAEVNGTVAGHILFSRAFIRQSNGDLIETLALAPISVHPDFQGQGIGASLIREAHKLAKEKKFTSIIVLGHATYYPRFGYKVASRWGINAPFNVPDEAFMALELVEGSLSGAEGIVQYPEEFEIEKSPPRIETMNEKKLVGVHQTMNFAEYNVRPLWSRFMPRRKEITTAINTDLISMAVYKTDHFSNFDPANPFEKWAAVEVLNFDHVPNGMDRFVLPGGLYAVFRHKGLSTDRSLFNYIFQTWLPSSKYELDDRPHFEVMGVKYKNNDPKSEEDIWVPVKPRS